MSGFITWLHNFGDALGDDEPDSSGMSPADKIRGSLATISAATGQPGALQAFQVQQNAKQSARNALLQQTMAQQNAAREQSLTDAQVKHLGAQTDALTNPQPKPREETWKVDPSITGPNGEAMMVEQNSGQVLPISSSKAKLAGPKQPSMQPLGADRVAQYNAQLTSRYQVLHPGEDLPDQYTLPPNATENDLTRTVAALSGEENATGQQAQRAFQQSQAEQNQQDRLDKQNAATSDEKKRADLAKNAVENLNQLQDIVNRRPDLFGPVGGRVTSVKQVLGTDDPDIGALKNISDNLGMVQQSAHGMRSAQHVEAAANSILNAYRNGPDAVKGAIQAARNSVSTFLADVGETPTSHPRAAKSAQQPQAKNDPLNIR